MPSYQPQKPAKVCEELKISQLKIPINLSSGLSIESKVVPLDAPSIKNNQKSDSPISTHYTCRTSTKNFTRQQPPRQMPQKRRIIPKFSQEPLLFIATSKKPKENFYFVEVKRRLEPFKISDGPVSALTRGRVNTRSDQRPPAPKHLTAVLPIRSIQVVWCLSSRREKKIFEKKGRDGIVSHDEYANIGANGARLLKTPNCKKASLNDFSF